MCVASLVTMLPSGLWGLGDGTVGDTVGSGSGTRVLTAEHGTDCYRAEVARHFAQLQQGQKSKDACPVLTHR